MRLPLLLLLATVTAVLAFPSLLSSNSAMSTSGPLERSDSGSLLQVHLLLQLDHPPSVPAQGPAVPVPHLHPPVLPRPEAPRVSERQDRRGGSRHGHGRCRRRRGALFPCVPPPTTPLTCPERDSPKSHILVVLFIIVTGALLVGATLKQNGIDLGKITSRGYRGTSRSVHAVVHTSLTPAGCSTLYHAVTSAQSP